MALSVDNKFLRLTIEKSLKDLPPLPEVVMRVLKETDDPDASASSLEKLILTDQALTMKVLRVVNSAYYGLSGQVSSISQAVVILGMQQIRNLVLSMGAFSTLNIRTSRQQTVLRQFWMHSFGSAAATRAIAKDKNFTPRDTETVFVGGLLHDIGRLFLFVNFSQIYDDLADYAIQREISIDKAEVIFLGMGHGRVGEEMAKAWRLPETIIRLIAHHQGPFEAEDDPLEMAVYIGDFLTQGLYFPENSKCLAPADPVVIEWLAMSSAQFKELEDQTNAKVEEAVEMYGMLNAA